MKKCPKCNKTLGARDKFCKNCGEPLTKEEKRKQKKDQTEIFNKIGDNIEKILDTEDTSKDYSKKDIENNKGLAIISYIGPLSIVSYLKKDESEYTKYHAIQGLNLFIIWCVYAVISILLRKIKITKTCNVVGGFVLNCERVTPWWISFPLDIIAFILLVINIIGLVYAILGKAKKLPVVEKIDIVK